MIKTYLPKKVFGLPKRLKTRGNLSKPKFHLYTVKIGDYKYFKVHLKRQNESKIKYFKLKKDAQFFLDSLKLNPYL